MKRRYWESAEFRRHVAWVATTLLFLALAAHPELRLLVPFLDAVGIDLLIALLGMQATLFAGDTLKPMLMQAWRWAAVGAWKLERAIEAFAPARAARRLCSRSLTAGSLWDLAAWVFCSFLWGVALTGPDDQAASAASAAGGR